MPKRKNDTTESIKMWILTQKLKRQNTDYLRKQIVGKKITDFEKHENFRNHYKKIRFSLMDFAF